MNTIEERLNDLFSDHFGDTLLERVKGADRIFKPAGEANPMHAELDSLDHVDFIMAVEDAFGIEIADEELPNLMSLQAIAARIANAKP